MPFAALVVLVLIASSCVNRVAVPVASPVTDESPQREPAAVSEPPANDPTATEVPVDSEDPVASREPTAVEDTPAGTAVATQELDGPFGAERSEKAERRVVYDEFRQELFGFFYPEAPDSDQVVGNSSGPFRSLSAEQYSWTVTGTFRPSASEPVQGPWRAEGRIHGGRYPESTLSMTAGDISILGEIALTITPEDQVVRRHGFTSVAYVTGLFPELAPGWARSNPDPEAHYIYDPYRVPTDLFPHGLSDEDQWSALRAVPEYVELDGWDHFRVTQGLVDPDYWNYRHRLGDGFFSWLLAEDSREIFEITIGANEDGRVERFRLQTMELDGGGLTFDVVVDAEAKEYLELPNDRSASQLGVSSEGVATPEQVRIFDEFATASREQFPVFDHVRRPDYLTVLSTRVRDEPSGAYEPGREYFNWPSVYYDKEIDGRFPNDVNILCLELEDNEWRYQDNTFEGFWRGFEDGSSLDGQIVRYNANGWVSVDIYATVGDRTVADPCFGRG